MSEKVEHLQSNNIANYKIVRKKIIKVSINVAQKSGGQMGGWIGGWVKKPF